MFEKLRNSHANAAEHSESVIDMIPCALARNDISFAGSPYTRGAFLLYSSDSTTPPVWPVVSKCAFYIGKSISDILIKPLWNRGFSLCRLKLRSYLLIVLTYG